MKAISVQQPWAWAIIKGPKRIENRTWPTNYRGPLAIHAGKSRERLGDYGGRFYASTKTLEPPADRLDFGKIIGTVTLVDCVRIERLPPELKGSPFAEGPWCWILSNPASFATPIQCRGFQGLFNWDEQVLATR